MNVIGENVVERRSVVCTCTYMYIAEWLARIFIFFFGKVFVRHSADPPITNYCFRFFFFGSFGAWMWNSDAGAGKEGK